MNTPANRVARREQVLGFFKAGRMNYESADVTIEALDARDDQVVIMGEEVVKPRDAAANAVKLGNAALNSPYFARTLLTWVCCNITSLKKTEYGLVSTRQGKS